MTFTPFVYRTIRLAEIGLINKWYDDFFPLPKVCGKESKGGKRIGLTNLSSSFAILAAGIAISFVVFIFELVVSFGRKYDRK